MIRRFLWIMATCLIYLSLAVLLWKLDTARHPDTWYLLVSAPVFLFSWLLSRIVNLMRRDLYER